MNLFVRCAYRSIYFGCRFFRPNYAFVTLGEVDRLVDDLVDRVKSSTFRPEIVISILSGGYYAGDKIASAIGVPMGRIVVRRYSIKFVGLNLVYLPGVVPWLQRLGRMPEPKLMSGLDCDISGARVLLVDDDIEHGETLRLARDVLLREGPAEVRTAVLSSGRHAGVVDFYPSNLSDLSTDAMKRMDRYGPRFRFKWPWEPISPHGHEV
jgi:hypoxanthine phosphoribosyltransferase